MGTNKSKIHSLINRAARAYAAGPTIHNARAVCERLADEGFASTMCYWNMASDEPERVTNFYMDILSTVSDLNTDCYLSVKAPAIRYDMGLLRNILDRARSIGAVVHFDAMGPDTADDTFNLIAKARSIYPKLGCTLPGRWRRSLTDADRAVEIGLRVRVVKGEWPETSADDVNPREGYLNIIDRLGAERAQHVAVATHNPELANVALSRLKTTGTSCELELLYGLPLESLIKIADRLGVPARMYVPYGHTRLPYRLREARRNPRIVGWFLRDLFRGTTQAKATDQVNGNNVRAGI